MTAPRSDLETGVLGIVDSDPLVIPKKRKTTHWKAVAEALQRQVALEQADGAFLARWLLVFIVVSVVECGVILWLVFGR